MLNRQNLLIEKSHPCVIYERRHTSSAFLINLEIAIASEWCKFNDSAGRISRGGFIILHGDNTLHSTRSEIKNSSVSSINSKLLSLAGGRASMCERVCVCAATAANSNLLP